MDTTKIHRKYPERKWNYKALSARVDDHGKTRDVTFYELKDKGVKKVGVEVYAGRNYIVGSNEPSRSQSYPITKVPAKYKSIVKELRHEHRKTKWSRVKRVDLN
jgi:hypothetical protein